MAKETKPLFPSLPRRSMFEDIGTVHVQVEGRLANAGLKLSFRVNPEIVGKNVMTDAELSEASTSLVAAKEDGAIKNAALRVPSLGLGAATGDGVALNSMSHPIGEPIKRKRGRPTKAEAAARDAKYITAEIEIADPVRGPYLGGETAETQEPWVPLKMSRRTWYRRKKNESQILAKENVC